MRIALSFSFAVLTALANLRAAPDTTPDAAIGGMTSPTGLAFGKDGRVFVSEYRNGNQLRTWPSVAAWTAGNGPDASVAAVSAESVAVNSTGSVIAVSITEDGSFVRFYHLQNGFVIDKEFGGNNAMNQGDPGGTSTVNATSLAFPRGLRFDASDNLWIADDAFNRILRIPAARLAVGSQNAYLPDLVLGAANFTTRGAALSGVKDIAFDAAGNLYGVSYNSGKIVRYNAPFPANRAQPDVEYLLAGSPVNLVFSGTTLYVTMPDQRKVWSFNAIADLAGGAIASDGIFGADSGTLQLGGGFGPQGVAFDASGNLYVCDLDNNRVVRFNAAAIPAPTLKAKGATKLTTTKSKLTVSGTATNATKVEYQLGKSAFRAAKGSAAKWSVAAKLQLGKNTLNVRATGPGGVSKILKFVITRK